MTVCTPDCTDKDCGDNGCDGVCGICAPGNNCQTGQCVEDPTCQADCTNKQCGNDGCGGFCGVCGKTEGCVDGQCSDSCTTNCTDKECGADGCGGTCGTCPEGSSCVGSGQCNVLNPKPNPVTTDCSNAIPVGVLPYKHTGDTKGKTDVFGYTEGACPGEDLGWGANAPEQLYAFQANATGAYKITLDATYDSNLYVLSSCSDPEQSCMAANDEVGSQKVESVIIDLNAGDEVYIVVDGWGAGAAGTYTLIVNIHDKTTVCTPDCTQKSCGDNGCGGTCGFCAPDETCSANGECTISTFPPVTTGCSAKSDCDAGTVCNTATGECVALNPAEWWAPVVYVNTQADHPREDFFTAVDYDGDWSAINNGNNIVSHPQKALVYSSVVTTDTHWFITYHFYFPRRYGYLLGHDYENAMRTVLMVVRIDGGNGTLELMETSTENYFFGHTPQNSPLVSETNTTINEVQWDAFSDHKRPILMIDAGSHWITGITEDNFDPETFTGAQGYVARWDFEGQDHSSLTGEHPYSLLSLKDTLWQKRFAIGGDNALFDKFGRFARDDATWSAPESLAPWAQRDILDANTAWGSILYDPATLVTHKYSGWGNFGTRYDVNPYALRVDIVDLKVNVGTDGLGAGDPDVYINLYLRDGYGHERKVLSSESNAATQNTWKVDEVAPQTYFNMKTELERYWFYGLEHPTKALFGIEVRDADFGGDDWLMDPAERYYGNHVGLKFLDFELSDMFVEVHTPDIQTNIYDWL